MRRVSQLSLILLTASAAVGQSGRVPESQPSQTPVQSTLETRAGYSESTPARQRTAKPFQRTEQNRGSRSKNEAAEGEVIKVGTDLVTIPVSVFDRNGVYIPGLQRADFKVFEDGVEQDIAYFGTADKPFTVILLLDTSFSTNYKIEEIRSAAAAFVDQLKSEDSVMVVEFDRDVNVLSKITRVRPQIYKAINKADFGYGTSLYDAVDFSIRKRLSKIDGRKAVVLFTDGVDTTSENAGFETTLDIAEESGALVFPIYYNTFDWNRANAENTGLATLTSQVGTSPEEYAQGRRYLEELAELTGGRVFRPESVPGGLKVAFEGIAEELRRQYNLGYIPKQEGIQGQRKQIRVRVNKPNLILRARDSYVVGSASPTNAN